MGFMVALAISKFAVGQRSRLFADLLVNLMAGVLVMFPNAGSRFLKAM
jgi:hypothetical protein